MIQKYKFVEKNIDLLRKLTKNGYVSHTLLTNYHMYKAYMKVKDKSRINRYETVAKEFRVSAVTVRRGVKEMKMYIRD